MSFQVGENRVRQGKRRASGLVYSVYNTSRLWEFHHGSREHGQRRAQSRRAGRNMIVFFQGEAGIRDYKVTGVQTCALPICFFINGHFFSGLVKYEDLREMVEK